MVIFVAKLKKRMYGLKEAAVLPCEQLTTFLNQQGYHHVLGTTGIWKHNTKPTAFCLCVDDIGVKYYSQSDLQHLISTLQRHYDLHTDYSGKHYMGFILDW